MADIDELALFCTYQGILYRKLTAAKCREALDEVMLAARQERSLTPHLADLLRLLESDIDEQTPQLVTILRIAGIPYRRTDRGFVELPGAGTGIPFPQIFECPVHRCSRKWVRRPGVTIPHCAITGHELSERSTQP
ncbi:hypothetical protein [Nonomuraea sp. NPDC003709]|uniref:hypothetical protein n=1 Tax=Nonomuraea sp. NPDC003709 TaxID=3154450 RepID=UPI00339F976C